MTQNTITEEVSINPKLVEKVKSLFTFQVTGVERQRQSCYELLRSLRLDGLIGEKDNSIINFQCDEGETGILKTEYTPEIHTREFVKTRPSRGIRFCHLRDAMLFAQESANKRRFEKNPELTNCIFTFWGSKTPIKDRSTGFMKKHVICVSFEETDTPGVYKPMVYGLPLSELFEGEYSDRPKFCMMAQVTYDTVRNYKRKTPLGTEY
jgi:hypothetical protein